MRELPFNLNWYIGTGAVYRWKMIIGHKLGFCYPQKSGPETGAVWCHWCGMKGRMPISTDGRLMSDVMAEND